MQTNLVIVESASKAKTIQKYLNAAPELSHMGTFKVMASLGHIVDLPSKEMAVDTSTWAVKYETIRAKYKTVKALRDAVKAASTVFIASDPDREGASIAKHLQKTLKLPPNVPRLLFHEITPRALVAAVLNPGTIDENLVAAQEARRILDRVVGYELSPLLWRRFATSTLSAGRVQSAALKLLVDRANAQETHTPEPYWILHGYFTPPTGEILETRAYTHASANLATWNEHDAQELLASLSKTRTKNTHTHWSATFSKKETTKSPPAPFATSTLQQDAYTRYGIPAKRTMQLAQALYEAGHITYMRTDSLSISKDAQTTILSHIKASIGPEWAQARSFKTKAANAQEAHEAIRPTQPSKETLEANETITTQHIKLYTLIWQRTVASQMIPARYAEVTVTVTPSSAFPAVFRGTHSILTHQGYLLVYSPDLKVNAASLAKWDGFLTEAGGTLVDPTEFKAKGDFTSAPSQYNEPQLVKALEKHGIGRPSTFATIVDKLFSKTYIAKGGNTQSSQEIRHYSCVPDGTGNVDMCTEALVLGGKETDKMVPTKLGHRVNEYLNGITPYLLDVAFTASMENDLDLIARGEAQEKDILNVFYEKFHPSVEHAQETATQAKTEKKTKNTAKPTKPATPKPSKSLRDFQELETSVVQTRFGLALFHSPSNKFVSLGPFIEWRNITVPDMTSKDARFLLALPIAMPNSSQLAIGRYGLYIKDANGKNQKLHKNEWDRYYEAFD